MEYLLRFIAGISRFVSDPPGLEVWFWPEIMAYVTNDGRVIVFEAALGGFVIYPDNKLIKFVAARNQFESEDGTVIIYFDSVREAWVINESNDPRLRVTTQITGNGSISGAGFYAAGATVTVSATPAQNWELSTLAIDGSEITNPYTFTMPPNDVVVFAVFVESNPSITTEDGDVILTEDGYEITIE